MEANELFWSALNKAMIPVAQRVYDDSTAAHRGKGVPGADGQLLTLQFLEKLRQALSASPGSAPSPAPVAAAALGEDYEGVIRDARKRHAWMFRLNFAMASGMILIFLGGAAGAVISAVGWGLNIWTAVFGGTSLVGVFGHFVKSPLQMVYVALMNSTRLDFLCLRYKQLLQKCEQFPTLQEQMDCAERAWEEVRNELDAMLKSGLADS